MNTRKSIPPRPWPSAICRAGYQWLRRTAGVMVFAAFFGCSRDVASPDNPLPSTGTPTLASDEFPVSSFGTASPRLSFLPPLAPSSSNYPGSFEATRRPIVTVCRLRGTGDCPSTLATFTRGNPKPEKEIVVRKHKEEYEADWNTAAAKLSDNTKVRVTVTVDGRALGSADVKLVGVGVPLGGDAGTAVKARNGKTLKIKFRLGAPDYDALLFKGQVAAGWTGDPKAVAIAVHKDGSVLSANAGTGPAGVGGAVLSLHNGTVVSVMTDESGLPTTAVFNGVLVLFRNYTATTVDLGIIQPDKTVDIVRSVPFDRSYLLATTSSTSRRPARVPGTLNTGGARRGAATATVIPLTVTSAALLGIDLPDVLSFTGHLLEAGACAAGVAAAGLASGGLLAVGAAAGCAGTIVTAVNLIVPGDQPSLIESGAALVGIGPLYADAGECLGQSRATALPCVLALAGTASLSLAAVAGILDEDSDEVASAESELAVIQPQPPRLNDRVAYMSQRASAPPNTFHIYTMNADGSDDHTVGPQLFAPSTSTVSWSPDETQLVFSNFDPTDNGTHIFVMDSNGANVHRVTTSSSIELAPAWSPDGTRIAFARYDLATHPVYAGQLTSNLYTVDVNGTNEKQITPELGPQFDPSTFQTFSPYSPTWSPDSKQIAFVDQYCCNGSVWTVSADGSNVVSGARQLTDVGVVTFHDAQNPSWSPDGRTIAYQATYPTLTGGQSILLVDVAELTVTPFLLGEPTGTWYRFPTWSPDGVYIAVAHTQDGANIFGDIYAHLSDFPLDSVRLTALSAFNIAPSWGGIPAVAGNSARHAIRLKR